MRIIAIIAAALGLSGAAVSTPALSVAPEQAVIVNFDYGQKDWGPFFELEKQIESAVTSSSLGNYDGNELAVDGSDGSMYMYGPDADKLFAAVKPLLLSSTLLKNIVVTLRYGDVNDLNAKVVKVRVAS